MSTPQTLTDEQAAAIWSGDTASLLNYNENPTTDQPEASTSETQEVKEEKVTGNLPSDKDLTNVWTGENEDDDDEEEVETPQSPEQNSRPAAPSGDETKKGRKPADLVKLVNELVQEEVLKGYEGQDEIKTIEEAKELIKENLRDREESGFDLVWKKKVQNYSPQIQAIIEYAEKGGKDATSLLSAISEIEKSSDLILDDEGGQEEIVRQVLKIKGFDDEEIKDQIDTLKDLDKLKSKAQKFLPELNRMKEERIEMIMREQEERDSQAREAARIYLQTVQDTLDKDQVGSLRLKREDKFKIMEALAVPRYKSISGQPINEFIKSLEQMQFGKDADYEHFLNVVHHAIDKKGFFDQIKETLKNELNGETVKKLKSAKNSSPSTSQEVDTTESGNKTKIQKGGGFKNPYSK